MNVQRIDNADEPTAARIVVIQRAAYAVEAALMSFDGIPPLHEDVADVQAIQQLHWAGAFVHGILIGVIGWSERDGLIEIDRLAVDPTHARQGVGRALVRSVPSDRRTEVSTGSANLPAVTLYQTEGFEVSGTTEVAPGVFTTQFQRG